MRSFQYLVHILIGYDTAPAQSICDLLSVAFYATKPFHTVVYYDATLFNGSVEVNDEVKLRSMLTLTTFLKRVSTL
mgnify:CR=1 FL=1